MTASLALVLFATVALCNTHLPLKDGILLTLWSSIINFFGPLQSGPAFRAVYLKKAHGVSLKTYGLATLLYYFFYAGVSGLFVLSGILTWYVLVGFVFVAVLALLLFLRSAHPFARRLRTLPLKRAYLLAVATVLQLVVVAIIYSLELRSIDAAISIHQAIIYTGAANFALFVSITPGAIGFREAFLVFSEKLHHISSATILTANVLDRALYVSLLAILFLVAVSLHARARLNRATQPSRS